MRLGFVGTGAMSGAIARGLRNSGNAETDIVLFDVNTEASQRLAKDVDATVAPSLGELATTCDIVILGVKPHVQTLVLQEMAPFLVSVKQPALLSIAAGRSLNDVFQDLSVFGVTECPPLLRVMPNVNAQIGLSMSALCSCPGTPDHLKEQALEIFNAVGECIELPESLFGVFSALAGASPAWFFQILDSFARAGVKHGLTREQAISTITQAMLGSARMAQVSAAEGVNTSQLIDRVCSPGGTTIAGLLAAQAAGLDSALVAAVDATVARDQELGG